MLLILVINKYQRVVGLASSNYSGFSRKTQQPKQYEKPKVEYNSYKPQEYEEKPSYSNQYDNYEEKLSNRQYEFDNPYSKPIEDSYNYHPRAHSRGNVSGKTIVC